MKLKKLPALGAQSALAFFLTTAAATAKDIDPQTLAKMSEAPAVRVGCGVADVDFLTPALENGGFLIGAALAALIAVGVAVLLHKRGLAINPIVAWVIPLAIVVPAICSPYSTLTLMAMPFRVLGMDELGRMASLLTFATAAFYLTCKVIFFAIGKMRRVSRRMTAAAGTSNQAVRQVVYRRNSVSERQRTSCMCATMDVDAARSILERTYNSSAETQSDEAEDAACLSR
ncbi:MAG: hypothetical protein IT343_01530 [Candidatus Melainabacteria bacterium]|jgi:hypothetical protein|nr:hypothetical protein [Candidatus Melainabacteria bacterium]